MCLIALALNQHPRFELVVAANRDEFLQRPTAALDWWPSTLGTGPVLGGRDLQAGGTWPGLTAAGRIAMLTNVRDLARNDPAAPSRGAVVPAWLATNGSPEEFWRVTRTNGHNPFNLIAADLAQGQWWWADDLATGPRKLGPGLYGLSNAALDTPWPKVRRLKGALADALVACGSIEEVEARMFAALADRSTQPDVALPDTGIGLERERWLAPSFIRTPDARYGTRCSTLLIAERHADGLSASIVERAFDRSGKAISQRRTRLQTWPSPRGEVSPVEDEVFTAV